MATTARRHLLNFEFKSFYPTIHIQRIHFWSFAIVFEPELSFFSATAAPFFYLTSARHHGHMTADKPVKTSSLIEENHRGSQRKIRHFQAHYILKNTLL